MYVIVAGLALTGMALIYFYSSALWDKTPRSQVWSTLITVALLSCSVMVFVGSVWRYLSRDVSRTDNELRRLRAEANQAVGEVKGPGDTLGLITANSKLMESYEAQARSQARSAHFATLIAGACGLAAVGAGIWVAVTAEATAAKYAAAIVAAVGTATGGYIAATFIRVQEAAMVQMRYYFQRPLVQSYLFQAERLSKELSDDVERTVQIKAVIAATISQTTRITSANETLRQPVTPLPPALPAPDPVPVAPGTG